MPRPMGHPTIFAPPASEEGIVDFEQERKYLIDIIERLSNKVDFLSEAVGLKAELDPWAVAHAGSKRPRDGVEAQHEKPPGLVGAVRTKSVERARVVGVQPSAEEDQGRWHDDAPERNNNPEHPEDNAERYPERPLPPDYKKAMRKKNNPGGSGGGGDPGNSDSSSSSDSEGGNGGPDKRKKDKKGKRDKIRMLKDKQLSPPEPYDSSASTVAYRRWRERFRALISAQGDGIPWDDLLDFLEQRREAIVCSETVEIIKRNFEFTSKHIKVVQSNLYHMMQQYTKGGTSERIILATREMALDQYRMLYFEGMHVTQQALFLAKGRVWRVQEAKKPADFAAAVDEWEQDREFLQRHTDYVMCMSDQQYALMNICPSELRREILKDYDLKKFPTYLSLKQHVLNLITRDRDLQNHSSKNVHEVSKKEKRTKNKPDDWWADETNGQSEHGHEWQEQEDEEEGEQDWTYIGALKGTNKGKGKGKPGKGGSPALFDGVCHYCNEYGHTQRYCPLLKGKGKGKKGKGKGKDSKGKGKGKAQDGYNAHGKGGAAPPWMPQRGPPGAKLNMMGDDPTQWVVGQDGRVMRKQTPGVNAAMTAAWNYPNWGYPEWDPTYAQAWSHEGGQQQAQAQAQGAFQVPQLGSVAKGKKDVEHRKR